MSMHLDQAQVVCRRGTIDTSRTMVAAQILSLSFCLIVSKASLKAKFLGPVWL